MFAIPKPGRTVPIPGSRKLLGPAGQNIGQVTQYWQRRLHEGDITLSETPPAVAAAGEAAKSTAPAAAATQATSSAATAAAPAPAASAATTAPTTTPASSADAAASTRSST